MSKIDIPAIPSGFAATEAINLRLQQIEDEFNDNVLYRSEVGAEPNTMDDELDMGMNKIINVLDAEFDYDAVNKRQVDALVDIAISEHDFTDDVSEAVANLDLSLGNVVGPASAVDGEIAFFNGTTGRLLKMGLAFWRFLTNTATYADLAAKTATVGQIVYIASHTSGGIGGGPFVALAGSVTNDYGTQVNSATPGIYWKRQTTKYTLEMFGCLSNTTIDEVATLNGPFDRALAWSNANKLPIYAEGTNYTLVKTVGRVVPWVSLHGAQKPKVKDDYSALEDGTIFKGILRIDCQYAAITNLGVDHGVANYPASPNDGLFIFSSTEDGEWAVLQDCVGLGRAPLDPFHALGIEGFINSDMIDCVGVRTYYGAAIKVRKGFIKGFRGYGNAVAGIVVRSNLGNIVQDLILDDIITVGIGVNGSGSSGTDYGVYVVADTQIQRVIIDNVVCRDTQRGVSIRPNVTINELIVNNVITDTTGNSGFDIQAAPGNIFTVQTNNHQHLNCAAWGMYPEEAVSFQANNIYCSAVAASAYINELIRIGPNVLGTVMDNIILSLNRSETSLGAIRYDNANATNALGAHRCYLSGTGLPSNTTVSQPVYTGAAQAIAPIYNSSGVTVIKPTHPSGAVTVTSIATSPPSAGTLFPWGYRLIIVNDDVSTITFSNVGTGFLTKVAGAVDIVQQSRATEFIFDGAQWIPLTLS